MGTVDDVQGDRAAGDLLIDAFGRIREEVNTVLRDADESILTWRPDADANSIDWLIWHLTRVQDDHLADAFGASQIWTAGGWYQRFGLPFEPAATGYGHSGAEVAAVQASSELLSGYHAAVSEQTALHLRGLAVEDLQRIVDRSWDPPVTLAVRLISVIADGLQHVGQAAYVKGLAQRRELRQ